MKLENLSKNLLWDIFRIDPRIIFTMLCTSTTVKYSIDGNLSHFHYFLEDIYEMSLVRGYTAEQCKETVRLLLKSSHFLVALQTLTKSIHLFSCISHQIKTIH